mmetsp:Transcript_22255/g.19089  ORF Transcript_22255/g.19089 Transcript_22255/m.19089 type:complete len:268 (+) Transcript_22255:57-860(+)
MSDKYIQDMEEQGGQKKKSRFGYTAPNEILDEARQSGSHQDMLNQPGKKIADREDKYHKRKNQRVLSPPRYDPFSQNTPDVNVRTYSDVINEQRLENERLELLQKAAKSKEEQQKKAQEKKAEYKAQIKESKERKSVSQATATGSDWDKMERSGSQFAAEGATPRRNRWDLTPSGPDATPGRAGKFGETPTPGRWDNPTPSRFAETPTPGRFGKSKWDDKTPSGAHGGAGITPSAYGGFTPTPSGALGVTTPSMNQNLQFQMTPDRA